MTTLVAVKTRDFIVLGCDSLATISQPYIDPEELFLKYFEPKTRELIKDENGNPLLKKFDDALEASRTLPYNHIPHVTKMFDLSPLKIGIMTAGSAVIGERSVNSLISDLKEKVQKDRKKDRSLVNTVKQVSEHFKKYIQYYYKKYYDEAVYKPDLQFILCGFGELDKVPHIFMLNS